MFSHRNSYINTLVDLWDEDNINTEDLFHVGNNSFLLQVRDNLTVHTRITAFGNQMSNNRR